MDIGRYLWPKTAEHEPHLRYPDEAYFSGESFQRALDSVIGPDLDPHGLAYLDDIIVMGASLGEHKDNLRSL